MNDMNALTQGEIQRFWEACGWSSCADCKYNPDADEVNHPCGWINPQGEDAIPDHNDLNAVFEALNRVSRVYTLNRIHPDDIAAFGKYECELYGQADQPTGRGDTIQEAIIRAVLAASQSQEQSCT